MDSTTTAPAVQPSAIKHRDRLTVAAAVTVAAAITGGVIAFAMAGTGYDEAAHRTAVEAELGHTVPDWATIADIAADDCAQSDADLRLRAAMAKDSVVADGDWAAFDVRVLGLSFRCPGRVATFIVPAHKPALGSAAADQIRRATETAQ